MLYSCTHDSIFCHTFWVLLSVSEHHWCKHTLISSGPVAAHALNLGPCGAAGLSRDMDTVILQSAFSWFLPV